MRKSIIAGCCLLTISCLLPAQNNNFLNHLYDYIENTEIVIYQIEDGKNCEFISDDSEAKSGSAYIYRT